MFTPLNLPKATLKLIRKKKGDASGTVFVFDVFRRKELLLTPEEWVRQHFLHYLVNYKQVPMGLIASEYGIKVNQLSRRCDGVVFSKEGNPLAIIECKAPEVNLSEDTLYQIAQYNFKLRVNWLFLTNGIQTIVCFVDNEKKKLIYSEDVPNYRDLLK